MKEISKIKPKVAESDRCAGWKTGDCPEKKSSCNDDMKAAVNPAVIFFSSLATPWVYLGRQVGLIEKNPEVCAWEWASVQFCASKVKKLRQQQ